MPKKKIDSWEELQQQITSILSQINADQSLALAAAMNPLLALEELDFEINPETRPSIEDRIRFNPRTALKLKDLREAIFRHAGHSFDINSPEALERVLFDELKIESGRPRKAKKVAKQLPEETPRRPSTKPLPYRRKGSAPPTDELEVLREAHPLMEPLLEYRRLDASRPRLAPRRAYEAVRQGKRRLPVERIRGRLKTATDNR